jgi:hypothetical protein
VELRVPPDTRPILHQEPHPMQYDHFVDFDFDVSVVAVVIV